MRWARKCEADLCPKDPVGAGRLKRHLDLVDVAIQVNQKLSDPVDTIDNIKEGLQRLEAEYDHLNTANKNKRMGTMLHTLTDTLKDASEENLIELISVLTPFSEAGAVGS